MTGASNISTKSLRECWNRFLAEESGQGMVEYLLLVAVIISVVLIVVKPHLKNLQKLIGESFKGGVFGENANFYYFPLRRR